MNSLNIKGWDMNSMSDYPVIVNLSRRKGGKTFMTRHFVRDFFVKKKKIKNILVISETGLFNDDYLWLDKSRIVSSFNEDLIESILDRQKKLIENDRKGDNELLLILDDVINMSDSNRTNIKLLSRLFTLSRHFKISVILNTQYIKADVFPPICRDNSDVLICFIQNNKDNKKMISQTWLSIDDNDMGFELVDKIPDEHHRVLVIDNTKTSKSYSDFCFHYKADAVPKSWRFKY